ncbi:MAG: hypothetical protein Q8L27_00880 [archaeon]|nr:hypothetical protein [archaeon]
MKRSFGDLSELEQKTLYVGLDNSNHAGKRIGEIIVATFSFNPNDSVIQNFGRGKKYEQVNYWFKDKSNPRDCRFGVLIDEKYNHIHQNIPIATPELVLSFLKFLNFTPQNLDLHIDGVIHSPDRKLLKDAFQGVFQNIGIHNYIKHQKVHRCPMLVYAAHLVSNDFYSSAGFSEITEHPKFVVLNCS